MNIYFYNEKYEKLNIYLYNNIEVYFEVLCLP